jgi:hypothetical protein
VTGTGPAVGGDRAAGGPERAAGVGAEQENGTSGGTGGADGAEVGGGPGGGSTDGPCGAHPGVAAELRALALVALDRLEPALQRMRAEQPTAAAPATCAGCPVCALLAVLRGERPELAVTLAEHLGGLLAVLRAALEEGDPAADASPADPTAPTAGTGRRVHRIPVERVAP